MIMEHNTIQPYVTIGENTILWSGNHVGHHTQIGKNVFIASHAVISGSVIVGENSFIGVNARYAIILCWDANALLVLALSSSPTHRTKLFFLVRRQKLPASPQTACGQSDELA